MINQEVDIMDRFNTLYKKIIAEAAEADDQITIDVEATKPEDLEEMKKYFQDTYGVQAEYSPGFNAAVIEWTITGHLENVRKLIIEEFNFGDYKKVRPEMEVYLEDDEPDLEEWKKIFAGMELED